MRRHLILVGIILALLVLIWARSSKVPAVALKAQFLYATNFADGEKRYIIAVTNITSAGVFISGGGKQLQNGAWHFSVLRGKAFFYWADLPARTGTWVAAIPSSPADKQVHISYQVHSAWDDFRRRTARWLPKSLQSKSSVVSQSVVIELPPE